MMSPLPAHEEFMSQAIEFAQQNPQAPYGSVLVDNRLGKVVARGVNASSTNPILHGEMAAIDDYVEQSGENWSRLTLYTTAEPCCMCQGAILWAGKQSFCEWKGSGYYFDVVIGEQRIKEAAWAYPSPTGNFEPIRDYLAFYPHLMDACFVDGEPVRAQAGGFYGGWITSDIVGPFKGEPGTMGW